MRLSREEGCARSLGWRCDLPGGVDLEVLGQRLRTIGWTDGRALTGLRVHARLGHEVLIVVSSGRVTFRVAYTTPQPERRRAAERLFVELVRAVTGTAEGRA